MKTGRLLKFQRREAEVHAYLYQDGSLHKAALYVRGAHAQAGAAADQELVSDSPATLEAAVRAWVEQRFPR